MRSGSTTSLPPLTTKQRLLLVYIYSFRYLSIDNCKLLLKHKDKRRIRVWIQDLEEKAYIQKTKHKTTLTFPHTTMYCLARNAKPFFLKYPDYKKSYFRWLYKEHTHTTRFLNHHAIVFKA